MDVLIAGKKEKHEAVVTAGTVAKMTTSMETAHLLQLNRQTSTGYRAWSACSRNEADQMHKLHSMFIEEEPS